MNQNKQDKPHITDEAKEALVDQMMKLTGNTDRDAVRAAIEQSIQKLPSTAELEKMADALQKQFPNLKDILAKHRR